MIKSITLFGALTLSVWLIIYFIFNLSDRDSRSAIDRAKEIKPTKMVVKAKSGLRIRELPNLNSLKIGLIPDGAEIDTYGEILEEQIIDGKTGKWMKIKYGNISGYSFSGFLDRPTLTNLSNELTLEEEFKKLMPSFEDFDYDPKKDKRNSILSHDKGKIIFDRIIENKRVISYSPFDRECNDFGSDCYNFIFEDDKLIWSDMNQESIGSPYNFNEEIVEFQIRYGCGSACDFYVQSFNYEFNFSTKKVTAYSKYENEFTCSNDKNAEPECLCSSKNKSNTYVKEKSWILGKDGKIEKIIFEKENSY